MTNTLTDPLTLLARSIESLRPAGAQPAWAEIIGPLDNSERVQWHPDIETLIGFVAPPECTAIGTVGYGWGHSLGEGTAQSRALVGSDGRRRCRVVCLMTRTGETAGYLRDGPIVLIDEPPTVGRVIDFIRRSLGLPTPPPNESTSRFLAHIWLNNVRGVAAMADGPLTWPAVAKLHPGLQVAAESGIEVPFTELVRILRMVADVWSWSYLAEQAAEPGWLADMLPAGAAGWMDEGVLSRWILAGLSGTDQLLDEVTPLLAPPVAKRLRRVLRQLDAIGTRLPSWST